MSIIDIFANAVERFSFVGLIRRISNRGKMQRFYALLASARFLYAAAKLCYHKLLHNVVAHTRNVNFLYSKCCVLYNMFINFDSIFNIVLCFQ